MDNRWQSKGEARCPQVEQTLLLTMPGKEFDVGSVSAALRACGGGEADLRKEEMMSKMSLGVDVTVKIMGLIHDCDIKGMVKYWRRKQRAEFERECPQVKTLL